MSKRVLRIALGDRTIAYHPAFSKVMGSVSGGVYLSQLMYWDSVKMLTAEKDGGEYDGWFFKTDAEIIDETLLSVREAKEAKSHAKKIGIIETELRGMPAKTHYKINLDKLEELIDSSYNGVQQVGTMASNKLVQTHAQNLPQITTESTTEIITANAETSYIQENQTHVVKDSPIVQEHKQRIKQALEQFNGRELAKASPQAEQKQFVKDYAPRIAGILLHAEPSDTDKSATRKIFDKKYPREWLDDRLAHYSNGQGEQFRKAEATAYWITNKLSEDWANRNKSTSNETDRQRNAIPLFEA